MTDERFFTAREFECAAHCGDCLGKMDEKLLNMLDAARKKAGIPFVITSGYRCPARNKQVGGVENSAHTRGMAADISCTDSKQRYTILNALLAVGFQRVELGDTWLHVDVDMTKPHPCIFFP